MDENFSKKVKTHLLTQEKRKSDQLKEENEKLKLLCNQLLENEEKHEEKHEEERSDTCRLIQGGLLLVATKHPIIQALHCVVGVLDSLEILEDK